MESSVSIDKRHSDRDVNKWFQKEIIRQPFDE